MIVAAFAAGDADVISQIDHDLLTKSGIKDRWLRAGPNVKAKFITYFQAMVRFSNIYYLNISVDENVALPVAALTVDSVPPLVSSP